jgi:hypothetical protein
LHRAIQQPRSAPQAFAPAARAARAVTFARRVWLGSVVALAVAAPAPALASGAVQSFTLTPASTQAGGTPDVSADIVLDYSGSATDTVQDMTIDLAPGLLAAVANVPATCSPDQLSSDTCPDGSQVGTGTVSLVGLNDHDATLYLMPAPASGDLAGVGMVIEGTTVVGSGAFDIAAGAGGQPVGELRLQIPKVGAVQISEIAATVDASTQSGQPFTRLPTSCSVALSSVSIDTYDAQTGSGTSSFTPTGCSSLTYSPSISATVVKDPGDAGAELIARLSQPGAGSESATKALRLEIGPGLAANAAADSGCLTGTPCTIGTATASSPLLAGALDGTVTLAGSIASPTMTIAFPAPLRFSLTGAIDPGDSSVTFADVPDLPLSDVTADITGTAAGRAFVTSCAPASVTATFTPQDGAAAVTRSAAVAYSGCPTQPPPAPPAPSPTTPKPPPSPATPRPPTASGSISGLATRHPRLRLAAVHGAGAPGIASIAITPPPGLEFSHKAFKARRTCTRAASRPRCKTSVHVRGLSLRGATLRRAQLSGGRLIILLGRPAGKVAIKVRGPLLLERKSLQKRVRSHSLERVTFAVKIRDAKHKATTRRLKLRVRH